MKKTSISKWKNKELDKLRITELTMIANNISSDIIKKYVEEEYKKIEEQYNVKLKKINTKPNINKKINELVLTEQILTERKCKPEYINNYIAREYYNIISIEPNYDFID